MKKVFFQLSLTLSMSMSWIVISRSIVIAEMWRWAQGTENLPQLIFKNSLKTVGGKKCRLSGVFRTKFNILSHLVGRRISSDKTDPQYESFALLNTKTFICEWSLHDPNFAALKNLLNKIIRNTSETRPG